MKGTITAITYGRDLFPPTITITFDKRPALECGDEVVVGKVSEGNEVSAALLWGHRNGVREERERWVHDLRTMTNNR